MDDLTGRPVAERVRTVLARGASGTVGAGMLRRPLRSARVRDDGVVVLVVDVGGASREAGDAARVAAAGASATVEIVDAVCTGRCRGSAPRPSFSVDGRPAPCGGAWAGSRRRVRGRPRHRHPLGDRDGLVGGTAAQSGRGGRRRAGRERRRRIGPIERVAAAGDQLRRGGRGAPGGAVGARRRRRRPDRGRRAGVVASVGRRPGPGRAPRASRSAPDGRPPGRDRASRASTATGST